MKNQAIFKAILLVSVVTVTVLSVQARAQEDPLDKKKLFLHGDWDIEIDFGEQNMPATLSFAQDEEGKQIGQWISFFGMNDLQDIVYEDNQLSFLHVVNFGGNEYRSTFKGTFEEDKLTGILSGERGDSEVKGKKSVSMPRAVGNWELKYEVGDRPITSMLIVRSETDGDLTAEWKTEGIENEVSDLEYNNDKLTLKRKSKMGEREWESTFEGLIVWGPNQIKGKIQSEMGEIPVEGKRIGAELVGYWNLDISADWGEYKQRLKIYPDMSAMYGTLPIEEVKLEGNKVTFETEWEFNEEKMEMTFEGKLADEKLTGELETSMGVQDVEGVKLVPHKKKAVEEEKKEKE